MKFSERLKLEKEYYKWLESIDEPIKDCPSTVLTFLMTKDLLYDDNFFFPQATSTGLESYESWIKKLEPYLRERYNNCSDAYYDMCSISE